MSDLYRLVYASKNLLQGAEPETAAAIQQILDASQRNNAKVGVTGALMFNDGAFAQVLEGPRRGVEDTFERIQRDPRHGDVTVLQCGPAESRGFANWSMAFVGQSTKGQARFSSLAAASGFDLSRLSGDSVFAMLHGLVLEEEGVQTADVGLPPAMPVEDPVLSVLDVEQVRTELAHIRPDLAAVRAAPAVEVQPRAPKEIPEAASLRGEGMSRPSKAPSEAAVAILKAALTSERQRTTELRGEVDDLQVALASSQDQLDAMREERNLWAERARLLATALSQEASEIQQNARPSPALNTQLKEPNRSTAGSKVAA
ncbi:BLUF domain-containing protein [Methylobacterium longum]|uniref:BLUF domain-containing protein n=1 Tax=Methylobacterium longum TaxID=767694 RepID=A0ABT8AJ13_9HYPH|nr:BLUF domain-containing protein [Methylobacterium longum]MDN3569842.1 BLUF domain-containing protein [Methylobacterium longum]GJE13251.1 hypothetical protein FOHLNKBM_4314 [Methylobacterium longum]